MDLTVLALRVTVALAVVLGLVWFLWRQARRRGLGTGTDAARFSVVGRHSLGRNAGVTVLRVGDEALVLGVTEQSVQLLARTELAAVSGVASGPGALLSRTVSAQPVTAAPVDPFAGTPITAAPVRVPAGPGSSRKPSTLGPRRVLPAGLSGSALSPATWSTALEALRERTTRR